MDPREALRRQLAELDALEHAEQAAAAAAAAAAATQQQQQPAEQPDFTSAAYTIAFVDNTHVNDILLGIGLFALILAALYGCRQLKHAAERQIIVTAIVVVICIAVYHLLFVTGVGRTLALWTMKLLYSMGVLKFDADDGGGADAGAGGSVGVDIDANGNVHTVEM